MGVSGGSHQECQKCIMYMYLAELKRLTTHCKFGVFLDHRYCLDEALRDRMVRGLRSEKRLSDEPKMTLEKALEVAQGIEAAVRHSQAIKGTEAVVQKIIFAKVEYGEAEVVFSLWSEVSERSCRAGVRVP